MTGGSAHAFPDGSALGQIVLPQVRRLEDLGLSHILIAQRWWGSGVETEGSSLDCLAMTSLIAAHTQRIHLITAIHPGFFQPSAIAKWGATLDWITGGRWSINVTSGWNLREFEMYGIDVLDHDARYERSKEFIEVLRGAWSGDSLTYDGKYYHASDLLLEPRPQAPLCVFQGGQSEAALEMASTHSDWMFLNGGTFERIEAIVERVRSATARSGRLVRFAMYAAPLCRASDAEAWDEIEARLARVDEALLEKRRESTGGAQGMWASDDELSSLDTNEGYAARLIGSPASILGRLSRYRSIGIDMLHFDTSDSLFNEQVLPELASKPSL